jgi:uncharacterized protein (TIGR03086 family)
MFSPIRCPGTVGGRTINTVYLDQMELNEALALGTDNFRSLLEQASPDDWVLPTPCEGWSVSDLVAHVARGSDMTVLLLNGASRAESSQMFQQQTPSDALGECRRALEAQLSALTGVVDLDQIVHHPMGDISVRQLFDFRIGDLTLHAWNLARALALSEELPEQLVEHVYAALQPMEAFIGQIGVFGTGPSGTIDPDASLQLKLLDLTGRRP